MAWCNICNDFMLYPDTHKCPPIFEVCQHEYDPDYWMKIRARDEAMAAEKWAEQDDCESSEYQIVRGTDTEVWVRKWGESEIKRFMVSGESVPEYTATPIHKKEKCKNGHKKV